MIHCSSDMIYQSVKWYDMISGEYHIIHTIASVELQAGEREVWVQASKRETGNKKQPELKRWGRFANDSQVIAKSTTERLRGSSGKYVGDYSSIICWNDALHHGANRGHVTKGYITLTNLCTS